MTDTSRPVAIVTGSSSGIGRATAIELASTGWDVVVHGLNSDDIGETVRRVTAAGATASSVEGDMREAETANALVDAALAKFSQINAVVNNAGTGLTREYHEIADEDWQSVLAMHVVGSARLLRTAEPHLRSTRGAVVNVSSVAATRALPGRAAYGTAKAGVEGLTRNLAAEWAAGGVRVNAVSPGTITTPLVQTNFEKGLLDPEGVLDRTPLGRFGEPHEVASVIRFLLSDDSSYITGQTISVDGGWSIWGGWS